MQQSDQRIALGIDTSATIATVKFSDAGLPVEIRLDLGDSADPRMPVDPDGTLNRRVFRVLRREGEVSLVLDSAAIPAIIRSHDGSLIELANEKGHAEPSRAKQELFYRVTRRGENPILEPAEVPYYYLSNFQKKLDIRDDWAAPFSQIAEQVMLGRNTLLGHDRLYTLWQAVRNVAELKGAIIEVGVLRGGSTRLMAKAQRHLGKQGPIFACDTFSGHAEVDPDRDPGHTVNDPRSYTDVEEVKAFLKDYPEVRLVVGDIMQTAEDLALEPVALLHLDVDVYPPTKFCLEKFAPRIERGGLIVVDDYGTRSCPGVKLAVDEFVADRNASMIHLLTGQALIYQTGNRAG